MILKNLLDYYKKNRESDASPLPPMGFEFKEISFVIVLTKDGTFSTVQDKRSKTGQGEKMLVPKAVKRSGTGCHPNYLWDNAKYTIGTEAVKEKKISFLKKIKELLPELQENAEIQAVIRFLEVEFPEKLKKSSVWKEMKELNANISFSIENTNRLVCQQECIIQAFSTFFERSEDKTETCLLTGKTAPIARIHPLIQGVYGAQASGATLVSYNIPSAESFGKEQGYNAPVSQAAAFAYSTALNHLLDSPQKVYFDQAMTVIFWAQKKCVFEKSFASFLKKPDQESSALFLSNLEESGEDSLPFFVQILSPQGSRLSIRFSYTGSVGELKKRLLRHFEDLNIVHSSNQRELLSFYSLLQTFSPCTDIKHTLPRLAGEFLVSLFNDSAYPQNLLPILLKRLSDKEGISGRRAALIKAWLIRDAGRRGLATSDLSEGLNPGYGNIGYLLGRSFALVELVKKKDTRKKEHSSLLGFYKSASVFPGKVFPHLLAGHSFRQLRLSPEYSSYFKETQLSFLENLSAIPDVLSLTEQGNFAVGYYQQKQQTILNLKNNTTRHL